MQYATPFHTLVRSIVYQQLNGKAALTIFNRLIAAAKDPRAGIGPEVARPDVRRWAFEAETHLHRELARMTRDGRCVSTTCSVTEDGGHY